jgi:DNA-binding PadR family transcriptional regulator
VPAASADLSLTDWAVLGLVAEGETHGWAVARELAPDGALGRVWTVRRPLVYRSLATLTARNLIEPRGEVAGSAGPQRTLVGITRQGRTALRRWLTTPVAHVRDVRGAFLVKLALLERAGRPTTELAAKQLERLAPVFAALRRPPTGSTFEAVLYRWRREQARAVERFLQSLQ